MSTETPFLIELDPSIPAPLKESATQLRNRYLYSDIKEGEVADYADAMVQYSKIFVRLTPETFNNVWTRRGELDKTP